MHHVSAQGVDERIINVHYYYYYYYSVRCSLPLPPPPRMSVKTASTSGADSVVLGYLYSVSLNSVA